MLAAAVAVCSLHCTPFVEQSRSSCTSPQKNETPILFRPRVHPQCLVKIVNCSMIIPKFLLCVTLTAPTIKVLGVQFQRLGEILHCTMIISGVACVVLCGVVLCCVVLCCVVFVLCWVGVRSAFGLLEPRPCVGACFNRGGNRLCTECVSNGCGTDTNADTETDTDTDSDSDSDTDADTDPATHTDTDADADSDCRLVACCLGRLHIRHRYRHRYIYSCRYPNNRQPVCKYRYRHRLQTDCLLFG